MTGRRLSSGGRIDRGRPIAFTFNGRALTGYSGDTLASALLANGIRVTARSFKYHRPRGIVSAGVEEPGTWIELVGEDADGNRAATMVPLRDGLAARSVNCWPSPGFDLGGIANLFAPVMPAAFYYKTFKWPGWKLYESSIRHAAGLAGAPAEPCSPGRFEARHWHCDLLIAGAGPAGLAAALRAGRAGEDVLLADEGTEAGGALLSRRQRIDGRPAAEWLRETVAELAGMPNVRHLQSATVWGYREHNLVMVHQRMDGPLLGRSWRVRAGRVLIATGAIERMAVFPGNDRPGVMLTGAVQAYVNRWAVAPGSRAVVLTNNDSAYEAAADMQAAGIDLAAIIDTRSETSAAAATLRSDVEVLSGHHAIETTGRKGITSVTVAPRNGGRSRRIACDLLAVSNGWSPTVHLFSQSRGRLRWDKMLAAFLPDQPAQNCACIGTARGAFTLAEVLRDGFGEAAVPSETGPEAPYRVEAHWPTERAGGKQFLDLMNDVTLGDVQIAIREGYGAVEHIKRYTTGGMALDQGKTGNVNIIGTVASAQGMSIEEVGTTTFRAPYSPVEFGAIAGRREASIVLPYRHTPLTGWHVAQGATMTEAGARWRGRSATRMPAKASPRPLRTRWRRYARASASMTARRWESSRSRARTPAGLSTCSIPT